MKHLTGLLVDRGDLAAAGSCNVRVASLTTMVSRGRAFSAFHPHAPDGVSACAICDRLVLRGMGWWWDR